MRKIIILSMLFFFIKISAQNETINLKSNWFFGVEIGNNHIGSFTLDESKNSIQMGLLTEYYFAQQWSIVAKVKYFKTGVSFYQPGSSGWFGHDAYYGTFKGDVISIPVFVKWEFKMYKKFKGNIKIGYALNKEISSNYSNYSDNLNTNDYSSQYDGVVFSIGFNYFLNRKSSIYLDFENYFGNEKGRTSSLVSNGKIVTKNYLISLGYKYSF